MFARIDTRPRRQNSHRADLSRRCEPFLKWLRGRACYLATKPGHICTGKVRSCHVDHAGGKGMGIKVADWHALPMCDGAHTEQTDRLGWPDFEAKYKFDAVAISAAFWGAWPGRVAWERDQAA